MGIMLYGYDKDTAAVIGETLGTVLGQELFVISASQKENLKIRDILEKGPEDCFEEAETKMVMFLAFSEEQIGMALKGFPEGEGIKRPIFCGLTGENIQWQLSELLEHLSNEDLYWSERKT